MVIQLAVADLGATEAFYAGILELPVRRPLTSPGVPEHLELSADGVRIIFVEDTDLLRAHPLLTERLTLFPRGVGMTLHLRVEHLEEIYEALQEEELEILYLLERKPYGSLELWCFDPDGYLVALEEVRKGK